MDKNEGQKMGGFSPGDIVLHREWGAGRVLEVEEGSPGSIIVDFSGKPRHRMNLEIAGRALSKLPPDGLEALLLNKPENVLQWGQKAPLKLIAATLADIGKSAKPAELRKKLDRPGLLGIKWESWWKRVQPTLKQSPYFKCYSNGSYQLVSTVSQVPPDPLPSLPKKSRAARVNHDQLKEMVSKIEAGEIEFEALKDAESLRQVAREVVRTSLASQGARSAISKALTGPVLPARIILEELVKAEQPTHFIEVLIQLTNHIQFLAASPAKQKSKEIGGAIVAKSRLLRDATNWLVAEQQFESHLPSILTFVEALLKLGLTIWRKELSRWRSESLDCLSKAVALLAEKEPVVLDTTAKYLATKKGDVAVRLELTDSLLSKMAPETKARMAEKLLDHSLSQDSEFAEECFFRYVKKELQLSWISSALWQILSSCDIRAINTLAIFLPRTMPQPKLEDLGIFIQLATTIAAISPEAEPKLQAIIREGLSELLDTLATKQRESTPQTELKTLTGSIESVYRQKLEDERKQFESSRASLESEIERLHAALEAANTESMKMQKLIEQLKTSYRLPERWASFQGKKEVLKAIVDLYQEAFLAKDAASVDSKSISWILRRIEGVFQRHGVSMCGQVENIEIYNPALHEYIPGFEGKGEQAKIVCPGFEWRDPAGNKVILARAKVVEH